jgi:DnaJ domain
MSDDTYYTVLEIPETATQSEIKAAYRSLIKQVHPDTLSKLSPYLRGLAEDKSKELTEAYSVLSNVTKRLEYDRLIAEHRQQGNQPSSPSRRPQPQPAAPQSSTAGFAKTSNASPQQSQSIKRRFNSEPLKRWAKTHPVIALGMVLFMIVGIFMIVGSLSSSIGSLSSSTGPVLDGQYSQYPCDPTQTYSPIDRKPCKPSTASKTAAPIAKTQIALKAIANPLSPDSSHTIAGTYFGVVHNKTANLAASFGVLFQQKDSTTFDGCMGVKPPLYGGGLLHGTIRGSHIDFAVNMIRFQGEVSGKEIAGSYIVSKSEGLQELGDFHLAMKMGAYPEYRCTDGTFAEVQTTIKTAASDSQPLTRYAKPRPTPVAVYAIVTGTYGGTLNKRCAFLPSDNYGRCGYKPETLAQLQKGDRLRVLSPQIRAENGDDIRKVRTEQGWEGWIDISSITVETDAYTETQ